MTTLASGTLTAMVVLCGQKSDIARLEDNLRNEIVRLENNLRNEITRSESKLRNEITSLKDLVLRFATKTMKAIDGIRRN